MKYRYFLLALWIVAILSSCAGKKVSLFNGDNLDGWKAVLKEGDSLSVSPTFRAEDGLIHVSGQPFGYIRTERKFSDYLLHVEWRWAGDKGVDGGIFNFLQDGDKVWPLGVQLQMTPKDMGMLMGGIPIDGVEGPFFRKERIVAESPESPVGEWNVMEFLCKEGHIKVTLNGITVNEATCNAIEGFIGLQSEGGAMDFRNIYVIE